MNFLLIYLPTRLRNYRFSTKVHGVTFRKIGIFVSDTPLYPITRSQWISHLQIKFQIKFPPTRKRIILAVRIWKDGHDSWLLWVIRNQYILCAEHAEFQSVKEADSPPSNNCFWRLHFINLCTFLSQCICVSRDSYLKIYYFSKQH